MIDDDYGIRSNGDNDTEDGFPPTKNFYLCSLCGGENKTKNHKSFCDSCCSQWLDSPEFLSLNRGVEEPYSKFCERVSKANITFVRRVRFETCLYNGHKQSKHDPENCFYSNSCYGCSAFAPREPSPKDCKTCIHSYKDCDKEIQWKNCIDWTEYVPRSCGNCLHEKTHECYVFANGGMCGNQSNWQPRPAEKAVDITERLCSDCAKNQKGDCVDASFCNKDHSHFQKKTCGDCQHWNEMGISKWGNVLIGHCSVQKLTTTYSYAPNTSDCFVPRPVNVPLKTEKCTIPNCAYTHQCNIELGKPVKCFHQPKEGKILCYDCGKYNRKTNGEQHCSKNHSHVTNKCNDYTAKPTCGQCQMWTEVSGREREYKENYTGKWGYCSKMQIHNTADYDGKNDCSEPFKDLKCFVPRVVEYEICCGKCAKSGQSGCNGKWEGGNCKTFIPRPAEKKHFNEKCRVRSSLCFSTYPECNQCSHFSPKIHNCEECIHYRDKPCPNHCDIYLYNQGSVHVIKNDEWRPKPRAAEPPHQPNKCGQCGRFNLQKKPGKEYPASYQVFDGMCEYNGCFYKKGDNCKWPPQFMAKSCSICGHFHAEPRQSIHNKKHFFDGYCDGYIEYIKGGWDWSTYGKDKWARMKTDSCVPFNVKFTPQAAPVIGFAHVVRKVDCKWWDKEADECGDSSRSTCEGCPTYEIIPAQCQKCTESADTKMRCGYHYEGCSKAVPHINKCQNCEFLRKRDCGGGHTIDNCSLKNMDVQLHTIDCTCGGCNCKLFKAKTAPACARCGKQNPIAQNMQLYKNGQPWQLVPVCEKCKTELVKDHSEISWDGKYQKETAAGRAWFIDQPKEVVVKIEQSPTNYIQWFGVKEGEKITPGSPIIIGDKRIEHKEEDVKQMEPLKDGRKEVEIKIMECRVEPQYEHGGLFHGNSIFTMRGFVTGEESVFDILKDGKCFISNRMESDKTMFKCEACGYHDETRKKVKYCPICGVEVEKMDKKVPVEKICKTCYYNWDKIGNFQSCRPIVGVCDNYNKWAPMDGVAVEKRPPNVSMPMESYDNLHRDLDTLKRENAALAAKVEKLDIEIGREKCNYNDVVTQLNAANGTIEKLRQKGIPRYCRKCPDNEDCMEIGESYEQRIACIPTDKLQRKTERKKCRRCAHRKTCDEDHPSKDNCGFTAKPASLWKIKWQEKQAFNMWKKAEKQEVRVKQRIESTENAARYKRYAEEIKKKLAGAA